ncbi:rhodanese-like domain-containing protein [uncultured Umboniibacter sp.]|uniref:rhodanese-like domain-containing protein n=1 Tax=uncultured Umboniibacter sp. TaxID=1798917 RepID=UPI0026060423|nr:rhodanese-like domain-containing protein [uncultured Umboniibacter sp.]
MFKDLSNWVQEIRVGLNCIDASSAAEQIKTAGGTLIDVREPEEFNNASADGAVNIPRGVLEMQIIPTITSPDAPIYLHCATGGRATFAAKQLVELGYSNVMVITCPVESVIGSFKQ